MFSNTKVGDRVRIVLEAEVRDPRDCDGDAVLKVEGSGGGTIWLNNDESGVESVEVITPPFKPLVTFEPGDLLRWKHAPYRDRKYLVLPNHRFFSYTNGQVLDYGHPLTSEDYELVESYSEVAAR